MSGAEGDESDLREMQEEDPMRVRGSFYLAQPGMEGFGTKQKSKSPRGAKRAYSNKIGFPKKKAKLRLEPLANRNNNGLTYQTQQPVEVDGQDPLRVSNQHQLYN